MLLKDLRMTLDGIYMIPEYIYERKGGKEEEGEGVKKKEKRG